MTTSRNIVIAGAGIGGLTAALKLAAEGYSVSVLDQAPKLEETGAGIQLSPNATRILIDLGLGEALRRVVSAPEALVVRSGRSGRRIVRMPLGAGAQARYGAPYWVVHRADLQAAMLEAARAHPDIAIVLGARVEDYAIHRNGLTIQSRRGGQFIEDHAIALIGADGLWSRLRSRVGNHVQPQFRQRTAWRGLIPAVGLAERFREPVLQLWLGSNAHLVHYPVNGGEAVNIVAIARDFRENPGWSGEGSREDLLARFSGWHWSVHARELLKIPQSWLTWSLYDLSPLRYWGEGPVTLIGDAAHAMLPFLAQGAGMAIEDAAVLAYHLAQSGDDVATAFRAYENARRARVARVQQAARRNGSLYHLVGAEGFARNLSMRLIGGRGLIARYGWIYRWEPPQRSPGGNGGLHPKMRNEIVGVGEDDEDGFGSEAKPSA